MSLLTESLFAISFRVCACSISIQEGDNGGLATQREPQRLQLDRTMSQSLMSLRQHVEATRKEAQVPLAPASRLHSPVLSAASSFLIFPTESQEARCLGLEALAFSASLIHSLPPKNQHFSCDPKGFPSTSLYQKCAK